ncbi:cobalt transporter [Tsuneonella deserti]|uniref:Cobalt transporter n=2 Tax=Erythrobacteraceae TaxID=335929 RepID=A0ABQ1S6W9_9SPHN|nr:cobalt transporter [Tsuneonella deserti]
MNDPRWRRALWIALILNAGMFGLEIVAGLTADSRALMADAIDFLGDSGNYALSLAVASMALAWRARAAVVKAATMLVFGLSVVGVTAWSALFGTSPQAETMGLVGLLALGVNVFVAAILYRFRAGDSNMRSVWICSRNDAIGNLAVMLAALGVFGTGQAWPDLLVASIMAVLAVWGSISIFRQARDELRASPQVSHA